MNTDNSRGAEPGLAALVLLLRFHGVSADPEQIRHRFGGGSIGIPEMLRCAKDLGLKARSRQITWERLANMPLPGIARLSMETISLWPRSAKTKRWFNRHCRRVRP